MRRLDQKCPSALRLALLKHRLRVAVNVLVDGAQEMAGCEASFNGPFWVSTEAVTDVEIKKVMRRRESTLDTPVGGAWDLAAAAQVPTDPPFLLPPSGICG